MNDHSLRAAIEAFCRAHPPAPLVGAVLEDSTGITKAGIVPFIRRAGRLHFYVMKPEAALAGREPPPFQICKGTRMVRVRGEWVDMPEKELVSYPLSAWEPLLETALREGAEEIGLRLTNINGIFALGMVEIKSAKTGDTKPMSLFAAQVISAEDFAEPHAERANTAARRWCTLDQFAELGREDHAAVLRRLERGLREVDE